MRPYNSNESLRNHLAQTLNLSFIDPRHRLNQLLLLLAEDYPFAVALTAKPSSMVSRVETYPAWDSRLEAWHGFGKLKAPSKPRYHFFP